MYSAASLPWKECPDLIRILLKELSSSRVPLALQSHKSLVLCSPVRGAHRQNPSKINNTNDSIVAAIC